MVPNPVRLELLPGRPLVNNYERSGHSHILADSGMTCTRVSQETRYARILLRSISY